MHYLHQSNEVFKREIENIEEMGKEDNLSSTMNILNLQNKDDKEKILSHEVDGEIDIE